MAAHGRKLRMALHWDGEVKGGNSLGGLGFWSFSETDTLPLSPLRRS
jgi:hypothetical protein